VAAIDAKRAGKGWEVFVSTGGERPPVVTRWPGRGSGTVGGGRNFIDQYGRGRHKAGYDVLMLEAVSRAVRVPVIASGGAGNAGHFFDAFEAGADAALAASLFHFKELEIRILNEYLRRGIPIRMERRTA
jgi:cyclase